MVLEALEMERPLSGDAEDRAERSEVREGAGAARKVGVGGIRSTCDVEV